MLAALLIGCSVHKTTSRTSEGNSDGKGASAANSNELVFLDGKEISKEEMNKLDPSEIGSMNVVKDKAVIKSYTTGTYDGVILIHSKKPFPQPSTERASMIKTPSGLLYQIIEPGAGEPAKEGDEILLREMTSYRDGTVLYSNFDKGNPVKVLIGGNQATAAVDEGLRGMKTGEVRKLIAPPYLVKRTSYPPNVSPDSTLVMLLKLHQIVERKSSGN